MPTTGILPPEIASLLDVALVCELTVVDARGRPVTYPLIPFYDGEKITMTSSVRFNSLVWACTTSGSASMIPKRFRP